MNLPTAKNSAVEKAKQSKSELEQLKADHLDLRRAISTLWETDQDISKRFVYLDDFRDTILDFYPFTINRDIFDPDEISKRGVDKLKNEVVQLREIVDGINNRERWFMDFLDAVAPVTKPYQGDTSESADHTASKVDAVWEEIRSEMPVWEAYFKTEGYLGESVDVSGATEPLLLKTYRDVDEMEDATETDVGVILSHMQLRVPALALRVSSALKEDGTPPPNRKALKALHHSAVVNVQWTFFIADLQDHESFTHFPHVETGKKAQAFLKRIVKEKDLRLNIFSEDYWHKTGDTHEATYPDMYRGRDLRNDEIEAEIEVLKGLTADIRAYKDGTPIEWIENVLAQTEPDASETHTEEAEGEPDWEQRQQEHVKRLNALPGEIKAYIPKWVEKYEIRDNFQGRDTGKITLKLLLNARCQIEFGKERGPDPFFKEEMEELLEQMRLNDVALIEKVLELLDSDTTEKEEETLGESEYGLDTLMIGYYKRGQSTDIRFLSFKVIASRQLDDIPMRELPESLRNEVLKLVEEEAS